MVAAITGAIKGSSRETLYQELGMEYLYQKISSSRFCLLYKVFSTVQLSYIYNLLPPMRNSHRNLNSFNMIQADLNISRTRLFLMSLMSVINWILTFAVLLCVSYFVIHY